MIQAKPSRERGFYGPSVPQESMMDQWDDECLLRLDRIEESLDNIRYELGKLKIYILKHQWPNRPLREIADQVIADAIRACNGNKEYAAKKLGVSLKTIYNRTKPDNGGA